MDIMYFFNILYFMCAYFASCGAADELILHPEHGIAFENVGLLDNDMASDIYYSYTQGRYPYYTISRTGVPP
jgi:hypothetical protein